MKIKDGLKILAALTLMSSPALADNMGPGYPMGPGEMGEKMEKRMKDVEEKLNLTADQSKRLEDHRKIHREEAKKIREDMKAKKDALRAELEKSDVDTAKINALHGEIKALMNQMADHRLEGILEVRKILTADQFKKFHELMKEDMRKGMGRRRGGKEPKFDKDDK